MADRYWVGGSGTWASTGTTNWSATSGGASGASAPTTADNVFFDNNSGTNYTVTITSGTCADFTATKPTGGTVTFAGVSNFVTVGNFTVGAGVTWTSTGSLVFGATTTGKTITTNGTTFLGGFNFNGAAGGYTLADNLTSSSLTGLLQMGAGSGQSLNLNNNTLTVGTVNISGAATKTIAFGTSGQINVIGNNGTVWNDAIATGLTITGTPTVNFTYNGSTGTRTIQQGSTIVGTEAQTPNFNITAGTDIVVLTAQANNLNFSGFSGSLVNGARTIYGNLTISSGMTVSGGTNTTTFSPSSGTKTITSNGVTLDLPITLSGGTGTTVQLVDNLTLGSTRTFQLTSATFDLNNKTLTTGIVATSSATARTFAFGTSGVINVTGNSTSVWSASTITNLTVTGTSTVNFTYNGSTGTRTLTMGNTSLANSFNLYVTAGTDIIAHTGSARNFDLTGFGGTFSNGARTIFGDFTASGTATYSSGTNATSFNNTASTQILTSNGKTFDFPISVATSGQLFQLADDFTMGPTATSIFTFTAGTFDLNGKTVNMFGWTSSSGAVRTLIGTGATLNIFGNNTTVWNISNTLNTTYTNVTVNLTYNGSTGTRTIVCGGGAEGNAPTINVVAGTDIITTSGNANDFNFTGFAGSWSGTSTLLSYGNITLSTGMSSTNGSSTITMSGTAATTRAFTSNGVSLNKNLTIGAVGSAATYKLADALTMNGAITNTLTLTAGTLDLNNVSHTIQLFASTNTNTRVLAGGSTGVLNVTGSGATIWSVATATNFSYTGTPTVNFTYNGATGTRTIAHGTTGGSSATAAPPMNITAGTDSISTTTTSYFNGLDFTGFTGTLTNTTRVMYGNLTLGSGMTISTGTNITTLSTISGTKKLTTNGVTVNFNITADGGSSGTWQLGDNLTQNGVGVTLTSGNLDLNGKTGNTLGFTSSNTNTRALVGPGTFNLIGSAGILWSVNVANNFSYTGNVVVNLPIGGAGTRTITHGGTSGGSAATVPPPFNITSGTDTIAASSYLMDLNFTGFSGTWTNFGRTIYGNLTLSSTMNLTAGTSTTTFSGNGTITSNSKTMDFPIVVAATGTYQATDALTLGSTRTFTLSSGTFDANSQNVTSGLIVLSGSTTRTANISNATVTISGVGTAWNCANTANLTFNATNSNINFSNTSVSARTFEGGDLTYGNLNIGGATGVSTFTINGNNTFAGTLSSTKTVAHTLQFAPGSTTTVGGFTVSGNVGAVVTLKSSTAGTQHNLVLTGGGNVSTVDYLNISYSNASPATDTWYAGAHSINSGNNNGWIFPSTGSSNFFLLI